MLVEFNRLAFVYPLMTALRTSPRVDRVNVRFAACEIVEDRLSAFAAFASDNDIPFSSYIGECAHQGSSVRGLRNKAD